MDTRFRRAFVQFYMELYQGNPSFSDVQLHLLDSFLRKGDEFITQCHILPLQVKHHSDIIAQCLFIVHPQFASLQVAFLDCKPDATEAISQIMDTAKKYAQQQMLPRIVVGLNGHVSYGVGFLADSFEVPISFDSFYNGNWLVPALQKLGLQEHKLATFVVDFSTRHFPQKLIDRSQRDYQFRVMRMDQFENEIELFGDLCNRCLAETPWYFYKSPRSLVQIISEIKMLLRPENLIFAMHEGKEVGFLFWHPDYNEVLPRGKRTSLIGMGIRAFLFRRKIKNCKLNAIGFLPEYRKQSILAGLLYQCVKYASPRYAFAETNFVWEANEASFHLNSQRMLHELRHYSAFECEV